MAGVPAGKSELILNHDPEAMGWRVGDAIGVATSSRDGSSVRTTVRDIRPASEWQLSFASANASVEEPGHGAALAVDGSASSRWSSYDGEGLKMS